MSAAREFDTGSRTSSRSPWGQTLSQVGEAYGVITTRPKAWRLSM
jgi:hypothetical protein